MNISPNECPKEKWANEICRSKPLRIMCKHSRVSKKRERERERERGRERLITLISSPSQ